MFHDHTFQCFSVFYCLCLAGMSKIFQSSSNSMHIKMSICVIFMIYCYIKVIKSSLKLHDSCNFNDAFFTVIHYSFMFFHVCGPSCYSYIFQSIWNVIIYGHFFASVFTFLSDADVTSFVSGGVIPNHISLMKH